MSTRLRQEFEVLEHKRNELRSAYDTQFKLAMDVSNQALQLTGTQGGAGRTEKLCDILDDRIKELNLTEEVGAMNVTIMEVARPTTLASYPIRSRFLAAGIFLRWSARLRPGVAARFAGPSPPVGRRNCRTCCNYPCSVRCHFSATSRKPVRQVGWYRSAHDRERPNRFAHCGRRCTLASPRATSRRSSSLRLRQATASRPSPATWRSPWPRRINEYC